MVRLSGLLLVDDCLGLETFFSAAGCKHSYFVFRFCRRLFRPGDIFARLVRRSDLLVDDGLGLKMYSGDWLDIQILS